MKRETDMAKAEEKKKYVCGFLFNSDKSKIVLIRKNKPEWQKGKLNGVGGKIEINETPLAAMSRDAYEEMGVVTDKWDNFLTIDYKTCVVYFFRFSDDEYFDYARMRESEVIEKFELKHFPHSEVIPNLNWIVNLALDPDISKAEAFEVKDRLSEYASQSRPAVLMPDKEISNDTVSQMQKDFMPVMDSHFKEGMYSGYAFGLQDGYKLALSQVQAIDGRELLIKFAEFLNENINEDEIDAFLRDNAT